MNCQERFSELFLILHLYLVRGTDNLVGFYFNIFHYDQKKILICCNV